MATEYNGNIRDQDPRNPVPGIYRYDTPEEATQFQRSSDMERGFKRGREIFYEDPDMQMMRQKRLDLSKGYSGSELGSLREQARGEVEGQRGN